MAFVLALAVFVGPAFFSALLAGSSTALAILGFGVAGILVASMLTAALRDPPASARAGKPATSQQPQDVALADYRGQKLPPAWAEHLTGQIIEIDGEVWTVNAAGELVPQQPADELASMDAELREADQWLKY